MVSYTCFGLVFCSSSGTSLPESSLFTATFNAGSFMCKFVAVQFAHPTVYIHRSYWISMHSADVYTDTKMIVFEYVLIMYLDVILPQGHP